MYRPAGYSDSEEDSDDYYGDEPKRNVTRSNGGPKTIEDAIRSNNFLVVSQLVDLAVRKGLSLNCASDKSVPLILACSHGFVEAVELLLQNGADPNFQKELTSPLSSCCIGYGQIIDSEARKGCVRLLLNANADPNVTNCNGRTPLMVASKHGFVAVVQELISSKNCNINATDPNGWTALFHAYNEGHFDIVDLLKAAGCDESIKCCDGLLAIDVTKDVCEPEENVKVEELFTEPTDFFVPETINTIQSPLQNFLEQLPDENGNGGFSKDVHSILVAAGFEALTLPAADFSSLLRGSEEELRRIGVKLRSFRLKIISVIHNYHLEPWRKTSIPNLTDDVPLTMEVLIHFISNVTRHLTIMNAALTYVERRIHKDDEADGDMLIIKLVHLQEVQQKLKTRLKGLLEKINKIKSIGEKPADFVSGENQSSNQRWKLLIAATAVFVFCIYF